MSALLKEVPLSELKAVFREFDIDGDGWIQEGELRAVMSKMGQQPTDDELHAMFKAADVNGDGKIDFDGKGSGPYPEGRSWTTAPPPVARNVSPHFFKLYRSNRRYFDKTSPS